MIVQENLDNGLVRTYSNAGFKIHGGSPESDYDVVYDPEDQHREYVETSIPVDAPVQGPTQYSKIKILMGAQAGNFADALIAFIESDKTVEYIWNASNVIEDNALFNAYLSELAAALNKTESEIREFLNNSCIKD